MNLKLKVKSYSFWVSLASAIILILKLVGQKFGFTVDEGLISDLFTSLCAILVIMGIIVVPSASNIESKAENTEKLKEKKDNMSNKNQQTEEIIVEQSNKHDLINEIKVEDVSVEEKNNCLDETAISESYHESNIENSENEIIENNNTDNFEKTEINEVGENNVFEKINQISSSSFNVESFIDKVCAKRYELNENVMNFVDFLQNEIKNLKNNNK